MKPSLCIATLFFSCFLYGQSNMVGNYTQQDPTSPGIQQVANEAAVMMQREHPDYRLVEVRSAATQVVAGLNYALRLAFSKSGELYVWDLIVHQSLQGQFSVTDKKLVAGPEAPSSLDLSEVAIPEGFVEKDTADEDVRTIRFGTVIKLQEENPGYKFVELHKAALKKGDKTQFFFVFELRHEGEIAFWKVTGEMDMETYDLSFTADPLPIDTSGYKTFSIVGGKSEFPPKSKIKLYWRLVDNIYYPEGRFEKFAEIEAVDAPFPGGGVSGTQIENFLQSQFPDEEVSKVRLRSLEKGQQPEDLQVKGITGSEFSGSEYFNNYVVEEKNGNLAMFLDVLVAKEEK